MSTLSVPIPASLDNFITSMIQRGIAENKAQVVRRALREFAENQAIEAVLQAEREVAEGKILRGDLRKLARKLP